MRGFSTLILGEGAREEITILSEKFNNAVMTVYIFNDR